MTALADGSRPIFDTMQRFFTEDGWNPVPIAGQPILQMGFAGRNGSWPCYAQALDEHQRFLFVSAPELRVPADRRRAVAEFVARANYGMFLGCLDMDFTDGEVRCKTTIDVEDGQLTPAMIRVMVYTNVMAMDKYLPGITSVIQAGTSPAEALSQVERQPT